MKTTEDRSVERERLDDEIATTAAHLNAATARWLELVAGQRAGGPGFDPCDRWLAFRCGLSLREARTFVQVAEALEELPAIRAAFRRGELSFGKVRALVRVASPACEESLLELAFVLTASQLERALRVYRRITRDEARESHELEYLDYYWDEDGSLLLRARLAAEDGTIVVRALDAARERICERRRQEQKASKADGEDAAGSWDSPQAFEPPRSTHMEAVVELARAALQASEARGEEDCRLVVHVDAESLVSDAPGRSELAGGPSISPETARRLGCDAETVTSIEREGLPVSIGRKRRTVPPRLRRLVEARDAGTCRWPGCDRRRHLQAHHRRHWAQGGETALDNLLLLLCFHHHRLVHEGGYTIEDGTDGGLRFRNRHGVLCPRVPRSPPRGSAEELRRRNEEDGLVPTPDTNRNGEYDGFDLACAVDALLAAVAP